MQVFKSPCARWIPLVAVVVILGMAVVSSLKRGSAAEDEEEEPDVEPLVDVRVATAESLDMPAILTATGYVEALPNGEARLSAPMTGRLTRLTVREGDKVTQGQVLAELYNADLAGSVQAARGTVDEAAANEERAGHLASKRAEEHGAEVIRAEAALRDAEARLERLRNGARPQEIAQIQAALEREQAALDELEHGTRGEDIATARRMLEAEQAALARLENGSRPQEIDQAEAALAAEKADLDRLVAGPRPQEVSEARAKAQSAKVALQGAKDESARKARLLAEGIISLAEKQSADVALAAAEADSRAADEQLSALEAGTRPEEIRAQQARVNAAEASLDLVRSGSRPEERAEQQAKVHAAEEELKKAEAGPRPEAIEQQRAAVRKAQAELDLIAAAPRNEDTAQAEAAVVDARGALGMARAGRLDAAAMRDDIKAAAGRRTQASGDLVVATSTLANSVVRAPVSGTVSWLTANVGETLSTGEPFIKILNLAAVQVRAQLPLDSLIDATEGLEAEVTIEGLPDRTFSGAVSTIAPDVAADTGTGNLLVLLSNGDGLIREGMFATVNVHVPPMPRVLVPEEAIIAEEAEDRVYVVDGDDVAHEVLVTLGEALDGKVEVLEGLEGGEEVIIQGAYGLPDESPVRVRR